jgi:integrase
MGRERVPSPDAQMGQAGWQTKKNKTKKGGVTMKIYKRGKWYWMDAVLNGERRREPLKTTNWQEARHNANEMVIAISGGKTARNGGLGRQTFNAATDAYLDERRLHSADKTYQTDRERSRVLRKYFGDISLRRIAAEMVVAYQKQRKEQGISGRTVNLEIGLLRRVMRRNKQWARISEDVRMLPERPTQARVLTPDEKARLLTCAASRPEWQLAHNAAVLALNTTMRGCELKGLRWKDVDFFDRNLTIRRVSTKTDAGARVIPLNRDALAVVVELHNRAERLGSAGADYFVFPACENGHIDPVRPMKGWRSAWRSLTKAAGLQGLRFHDLRHQAITELAERGLGDQTIMSIAGHVSREMLDHYSHIRLESKRRALALLEGELPASVVPENTTVIGVPN